MKQLIEAISTLALSQECIVLPGFGAFIKRPILATANKYSGELRPAADSLYFNSAIQQEDGLLTNYFAQKEGIPFSEAKKHTESAIAELSEYLNTEKNLSFSPLGNFFHNSEGKLFFMPSSHLNFSEESFGLPVLKAEVISNGIVAKPTVQKSLLVENDTNINRTATLPSVETEQKQIIETSMVQNLTPPTIAVEEEKNTEFLLPAAQKKNKTNKVVWAGAAAILLAGTGGFMAYHFSQKNEQLASFITPQKRVSNVKIEPSSAPVSNDRTETAVPVNKGAYMEKVKNSTLELKEELKGQSGKFFVCAGMYVGESAALDECYRWKQKGINATMIETEGSSLIKIVLGRYKTQDDAEMFAQQLKQYAVSNIEIKQLKNLKF